MRGTPHTLRHRLVTLILAMNALTGCFVADALDLTDEKPPKARPTPPPGNPPPARPPSPIIVPAPALARRIALDLTLGLPKTADLETLVADTSKLGTVVDAHLLGSASSLALSRLQPRIWGLDETRLTDLERMIGDGDTDLELALTDTTRRAIVEEPALMLRYALDKGLPFSSLFTASYTIVHQDLLTFWNLADDGAPWPGEPYRFATFADGRPDAGVLGAWSLLAANPAAGDLDQGTRTRRLLAEFACQPFEAADAHLFHDLTAAELGGDLKALAMTKAACAGCHAQFSETAPALEGLAAAPTLSEWLTYQAPAATYEGLYAGQPFQGLAGLAASMATDPRVHRCEIERLAAAILQRPLTDMDRSMVARAVDQFNAKGSDVKAAASAIFKDSAFALGPIGPTAAAPSLYGASGIRVLKRAHWQGMVAELAPGATTVEFPPELDPGSEETVSSSWMVPSGSYWHAVDRVARQTATAVVAAELADDTTAATRRLLTLLPDGAAETAEASVVYAQIRALWLRLTGEELAEASQTYSDFQTLWATTQPDGTAAGSRRAWRVVFVALLTHPKIITY